MAAGLRAIASSTSSTMLAAVSMRSARPRRASWNSALAAALARSRSSSARAMSLPNAVRGGSGSGGGAGGGAGAAGEVTRATGCGRSRPLTVSIHTSRLPMARRVARVVSSSTRNDPRQNGWSSQLPQILCTYMPRATRATGIFFSGEVMCWPIRLSSIVAPTQPCGAPVAMATGTPLEPPVPCGASRYRRPRATLEPPQQRASTERRQRSRSELIEGKSSARAGARVDGLVAVPPKAAVALVIRGSADDALFHPCLDDPFPRGAGQPGAGPDQPERRHRRPRREPGIFDLDLSDAGAHSGLPGVLRPARGPELLLLRRPV